MIRFLISNLSKSALLMLGTATLLLLSEIFSQTIVIQHALYSLFTFILAILCAAQEIRLNIVIDANKKLCAATESFLYDLDKDQSRGLGCPEASELQGAISTCKEFSK